MPNLGPLAALFNLRPDRAADYLLAKGFKLTGPYWELDGPAHSHVFTVANLAKLDVLADLKSAVQQAIDEGQTEKWFETQLVDVLKRKGWWGPGVRVDPDTLEAKIIQQGSLRRLKTIYGTNLQSAYMAGRHRQALEQSDRAPWAQYLAIRDHRTRPAHAALHGQVFRLDSPAWSVVAPPVGYNCFPAETIVSGRMKLGLKTWYAGPMVEMEAVSGKRLTVTANHPILTRRGWLRADQVDKSDCLLSHARGIDASASGIVDHEDAPTRADDCFNALAAQGMRVVDIAPFDFDGDALNREGHIYIAGANSILLDRAVADSAQGSEDRLFVGAGHESVRSLVGVASALSDPSATQSMLAHDASDVAMSLPVFSSHGATGDERVLVTGEDIGLQDIIQSIASLPCGAQLPGDAIGRGLDALPLDALGFTAATGGNAIDTQNPHDGSSATSVLFSQLVDTFPRLITIEKIRSVRKFQWSGHVFDFETETGLIVANGLIVHNCRCRARYLSDRELANRGLKPAEDVRILEREPPGKRPVDPLTGETPARWLQRGVSVPDPLNPHERLTLWADPGWDHLPGSTGAERRLVDRLAARADALSSGVRQVVLDDLARRGADFARAAVAANAAKQTAYIMTPTLSRESLPGMAAIAPSGLSLALDHDYTRHAMHTHGDAKAESARGQRAITPDDFAKLPQVLSAALSVVPGDPPRSANGAPRWELTADLNGEQWTVVLEVRRKQGMIVPYTLWVK